MAMSDLQSARRIWGFWAALALVIIVITSLLGGWAVYRAELGETKADRATTLSAIAKLKAATIVEWRESLASEAWRLANAGFLQNSITRLDDPAIREEVRRRLKEQTNSGVVDVLVFSPDGRLLLSVGEASPEPIQQQIPEHRTALEGAMKSPRAFLSDLHRSTNGTIYMGAAAAVRDAASNPVAVVLVHSDAAQTLFPHLERLPTESPSAETLLVRRDGSDVLYLNDLRHQQNTALNLRMPLSQVSLPAVQAVLGASGAVEGADYRGVEVLTEVQAIPDSNWKLLAKVDRREIETEARKGLFSLTLIVALLSLLAAAVAALIAARRQLALARTLEQERRKLEVEEKSHLADLNRSANQLHNVFEASPIPLALYTPKGQLTYLNTAFVNMLGYTIEDIPTLDEWWPKAYPDPEYRKKIQTTWDSRVEETMHTSTTFQPLEADVHGKDGRVRTVLFSAAPLGGGNKDIMIVHGYDLTEVRASEKRILQLSRLYLALSQCSQAIIKSASEDELLDRVCKVVVEHGGMKLAWIGLVDDSSLRLVKQVSFGQGKEYLEGLDLSLAPDSPRGKGPTAICIRENRPVWCQDFTTDPMTKPWQERGKSFGWAASASVPLRKEAKPVGVLKIFSQIENVFDSETRALLLEIADSISFALDAYGLEQARREAEIDLRISRDMLAKVINAAPEAIFWKDEHSVYLGCNENYARSAGLSSPGEIVGKTDFDLPGPRDEAEAVRADDALVISTKSPLLHHVRVRKNADGTELWMETSKVPLVGIEGRVYGVLGILQDITEEKNLERDLRNAMHRAEAASEAKGQFLAVMSHELRTPLTGVLGFADLLADTKLDPDQSSFVRTIRSSGDHLLHVVNDILDFSSIEAGGLHLETSHFVLADLIESTAAIVGESAEEKGIAFHLNVSAEVPPILSGDARRIRQILLNLLGNAVKFTTAGSVKLLVSLCSDEDRSAIHFVVEDTGPGIPPEVEDLLFTPFAQADSTLSRRFRGTGLGLAISLRLARAMGGDITLLSSPGKGSTFTFRLPCEVVSPGTLSTMETPADATAEPPEPAEDHRPVLLVDDDHVSILLTGKILSGLGYTIDVATGGQAAIDAFAPGKHLAILMDMQMPGIDGIEATRRIRAAEKAAGSHRVPIIAVTANVMPGDREECLDAGMNDVVTKPINRTELIEKLARLVRAA
jgi:two-component system, sensor histidine kinase and response regulator